EWNALKLLNHKGEFISAKEGEKILEIAESGEIKYAPVGKLGSYKKDDSYLKKHIQKILELPLVNAEAIKSRNFKVVIDCVNSTGGIFVPELLKALGVLDVVQLYC